MNYLSISFSHKNSSIDTREKLSFDSNNKLKEILEKISKCNEIKGTILISTCNRMEVLSSCVNIQSAILHIFEILKEHSGIHIEDLEGRADIYYDCDSVKHIFSVAASLDSMVLGETQIVGQLKDAFRTSYDNGFCDKSLARVMQSTFKCASEIRNSTNISIKPVSIASVAVSKLREVTSNIDEKKALIIGVGEMSKIVVKHLISKGVDVYIMNRTKYKAIDLAKECGAKHIDYEDLAKSINEFEILFTATSAPEPIITDKIIKSCDFDRYWFDLALPRDIHYGKGNRVNLFDLDDLKNIAGDNLSIREDSIKECRLIIERSAREFFDWLDTPTVEPLIKNMYKQGFKAAKKESNRVIENGYIPKEYKMQIDKMSEQIIKTFLHEISLKIRIVSSEEKLDNITRTMKFLMQENI